MKYVPSIIPVGCAGILGYYVGINHWQSVPLLFLCLMAGIGSAYVGENLDV